MNTHIAVWGSIIPDAASTVMGLRVCGILGAVSPSKFSLARIVTNSLFHWVFFVGFGVFLFFLPLFIFFSLWSLGCSQQ